jgi:hypothetical protein
VPWLIGGAVLLLWMAFQDVLVLLQPAECYLVRETARGPSCPLGSGSVVTLAIELILAAALLVLLRRILLAAIPPGRPRLGRGDASAPHAQQLGGQSRPGDRPPIIP